MKKTVKKAALWLLIGLLTLSCTGCVTGTIYGKPLDEMEEVDKSQGTMFVAKIMEAMQSGTLDDINQLGYHYGQEDAETFETFWEDWQRYQPEYGQIQQVELEEAYQFGNELVYVYRATMEKGDMMISAMFTDDMDLVMLFLYETGEAALEGTELPEGVAEQDVTLGAGGEYPLSGKITMPAGAKEGDQLPAVVLVGGDGANTMDMKAGNTYLYRDLAWGLAQQGIVSIRFDKRTLTYSDQLDAADADPACYSVDWEYVDDALLATEMLRSQPFVDSQKVYYIGHSQGGVVASRIDEQGGDYAGMILLATSPRPWYEVIYDQYINYGLVDQDSEEIYYLVSKINAEKKELEKGSFDDKTDTELTEEYLLSRPSYFWKDFLSFDYVKALKEDQKPLLILQAGADYQVKEDVDFAAWKQEMGGAPYATLKSYEGLNHLFVESKGCFAGHYKEYDMPGRASQQVIQDIGSWVRNGTVSE